MSKILFKVAFPIIITGLFAITIFAALNYQNLNFNFLIVLLSFAVYIFSFGFAIGQDFSSPIKKLLKRATELSGGDLTSRAYLGTKDEIGELSRVFNKIADELEASREAIQRAESSIEIKVKAKTQALEETIKALDQKVRNRTIELQRTLDEFEKLSEKTKAKEAEAEELKSQISNLRESSNRHYNMKNNQPENFNQQ